MPKSFIIKFRKTMPIEVTTVEADDRNRAIAQVLETTGEGEEIEVMQAEEAPAEVEPT
jgi:hypothetical protein